MMHQPSSIPRKIEEIIPHDVFVGTSLILRQGDRFLYGMRPPRVEDGYQVIELTGIGGGVEDEDITYWTGVIREAEEEIGCGVSLISSSETLIVRGPADLERVKIEAVEPPAAVVFRHYRTPPHQPWHEDNAGEACLIVFAATLLGRPWPKMELPWLIWLRPEKVLSTALDDVVLSKLLVESAELVAAKSDKPSMESLVRLTDSQEALGIALGIELPSFYRSFGHRG